MDEIIGGAAWLLLTQTGRLVLCVFSFGRWRGELLSGNEGRIFSAAGSLWFSRDGQVVLTHTGQMFLGLVDNLDAVVPNRFNDDPIAYI